MSIELQSSIPTQIKALPGPSDRSVHQGLQTDAPRLPGVAGVSSAGGDLRQSASADQQVDRLAQKAADIMFAGREIEVNGFLDDGSGRFVYRISDKNSGQLLAQTPPDALLRFYASYEGGSKPLVSLDA